MRNVWKNCKNLWDGKLVHAAWSMVHGAASRVSFYTGTGNEVPRLVTNLTDFFEENKEFSMILGKIWNFNVVSD